MNLSVLSNVRTNNFSDTDVGHKIGTAWGQAFAQKDLMKGAAYGVYHNYEGNYANDYDLSVCVEGEVEGKEIMELDENVKYRIFKAPPEPDGVIKTWKEIWELEQEGHLPRAYTKDYELHKSNGEVIIYIAIK